MCDFQLVINGNLGRTVFEILTNLTLTLKLENGLFPTPLLFDTTLLRGSCQNSGWTYSAKTRGSVDSAQIFRAKIDGWL